MKTHDIDGPEHDLKTTEDGGDSMSRSDPREGEAGRQKEEAYLASRLQVEENIV
jgi:hypothetical protein